MGSGFAKKKKQMKAMQEQLMQMQEEMSQAEYEGTAGNGLVKVVMNGEHDLKAITIKPECVDPEDVEGLQDLIFAAIQNANEKIKNSSMQSLSDLGPLAGLGF